MALPSKIAKLKTDVAAAEAAYRGEPAPTAPAPQHEPTPEPVAAAPVPEPTPVPTPEPTGSANTGDVDQLRADLAAANQRYAVLEGKYQSEVPRLHEQIRNLGSDIVALTAQLSRRGTPAPSPAPNTHADGDERSDEEILGADAVARIKRLTEQAIAPVKETVAQTTFDKFRGAVEEKVPDRLQVENHERFQEFMSSRHPDTGMPRGEHLQDAIEAQDAPRTVYIYNTFKRAVGLPVHGDAPAPTPTPTPAPAPLTKPLEQRVVPTGTGAASAPPTPSPKIYSRTEVAKGYSELAQIKRVPGQFHGKVKEKWEAWERDVARAEVEGRIVGK